MTLLRPRQINLRELFSVKDILNAKGFEVTIEGDSSQLLIPLPYSPLTNHNILFEAFNDEQSRSEVLKKVKNPAFVPAQPAAIALINHPDFIADRNKYSTSFEWYAGELMVRRFSSFSASYGVEVKDVYRNSIASAKTGDFDALVVTKDINLIYFECKTGKFNRDKILKCVERALALHCELGIMFIQGAIKITSLKDCVRGLTHPVIVSSYLQQINIKGNPLSKVYEWNNCFFATVSGNIEEQIRTIMRINAAKKAVIQYEIGLDDATYDKIGYVKTRITL